MKTAMRNIAALLIVFVIESSTFVQGAISLGFEDVPEGVQPDYILKLPSRLAPAVITETGLATFPGVAAFEGEKSLGMWGGALIRSPDDALIQGFTLRLYVPDYYNTPENLIIDVGGTVGNPALVGTWQEVSGEFATPTQEFRIYSEYFEGEFLPTYLAVDAVQLYTIPEPATWTLLAIGIGVLCVSKRKWSLTRVG